MNRREQAITPDRSRLGGLASALEQAYVTGQQRVSAAKCPLVVDSAKK